MKSFSTSLKPKVTMQENFDFPPKVLYENRYSNQDDLSILICGGKNKTDKLVRSVFKLYGPQLKCKKYIYMPEALYDCKTAVVNSDLFVFGGFTQYGDIGSCVRKFCNKTKTWTCKLQPDVNFNYCSTCTFKKNIYVMRHDELCFVYNFETNKLIRIADMIESRRYAACTVFEGKIVVTGGYNSSEFYLKSVEAYDYYENKWKYLPCMIEKTSDHASVSIGKKNVCYWWIFYYEL